MSQIGVSKKLLDGLTHTVLEKAIYKKFFLGKNNRGWKSLIVQSCLAGSETSRAGLAMLFEMLQVRFSLNLWNICCNKLSSSRHHILNLSSQRWTRGSSLWCFFNVSNINSNNLESQILQFPTLNKRLVIVILEGAIKTIFPEQVDNDQSCRFATSKIQNSTNQK